MTIDMFFIWLTAAVILMLVFYFTRNWKGNYQYTKTVPAITTDREVILRRQIAKLQHECKDMQGVMLTYNTDYVRNEYWDLQAQLQKAEMELQMKYGHSRKVPSFTRIY